jgi:hypothetical protein
MYGTALTCLSGKADLAEIDALKPYTGAFMRIRAIPVFNELDLWQRHSEAFEALTLEALSLYSWWRCPSIDLQSSTSATSSATGSS